jgi:hypothetical protein
MLVRRRWRIELQRLGSGAAWSEFIAHLDSLTEIIEYDGKRFVICAAPHPAASLALRPPPSHCRQPSATYGRSYPRLLTTQ